MKTTLTFCMLLLLTVGAWAQTTGQMAYDVYNGSVFEQKLLTPSEGKVLTWQGGVLVNGNAGGAPAWGDITGTLSAQTDLQTALDARQPLDADLTALAGLSGTNTIYYRSAAGTWSAVTIGSNLTFSGGTLTASGGAPAGSGTEWQYRFSGSVFGAVPGTSIDNALPRVESMRFGELLGITSGGGAGGRISVQGGADGPNEGQGGGQGGTVLADGGAGSEFVAGGNGGTLDMIGESGDDGGRNAGSIYTNGQGSFEWGFDGIRTTVNGNASTNRTLDLPDASGTVALTSQLHDAVTLGASVADILGLTGQQLTADDPGADRLLFWDDSEGKLTHLTVGSNLTITGTTLAASGGVAPLCEGGVRDNQPPASSFATLATRNSIAVLEYDDASVESGVFSGILPTAASVGSGLVVRIVWAGKTATSGNVRWRVEFERVGTDLDADSFDTATEANGAANGTSGIPTTTSITSTSLDGLQAGEFFRVRVSRVGNDGTNDTMSGDAQLIAVRLMTP